MTIMMLNEGDLKPQGPKTCQQFILHGNFTTNVYIVKQ